MPRCPICQYELDAWVGSDPCPECGQVPREYAHRFFTSVQYAVVIAIVIGFPAAHFVLRYASTGAFRSTVWAELTLILCLAIIFLSPPMLVYLIKDRFDRGLSRRTAVTFAAISLIPTCLLNVLIQTMLG